MLRTPTSMLRALIRSSRNSLYSLPTGEVTVTPHVHRCEHCGATSPHANYCSPECYTAREGRQP